jgi:hypothetical protein
MVGLVAPAVVAGLASGVMWAAPSGPAAVLTCAGILRGPLHRSRYVSHQAVEHVALDGGTLARAGRRRRMTRATKRRRWLQRRHPKSGVEIAATLRASATDRGKRVGEGLGELART